MTAWIGIDIGGTNIVCGVIDAQGTLLHKIKQPTEADQGFEHVLAKIGELVRLTTAAAGSTQAELGGIGIGTPGLVDPDAGISLLSSNLKWENIPLAARVAALTGLPVAVDNDVRMYIYGEATQGSGRGERHVLGVTVGTGLASALIVDGKPYYGGGFMAGELGHIQFPELPYLCGCGGTGCLETAVSATGMVRQTRDKLRAGQPSQLSRWATTLDGQPGLTAAHISQAYDEGDAVAREVFQFTAHMLARGLADAIAILSPDVVVIGGGVAQAGERLLAPLRAELERLLLPHYWRRIRIVAAELLDDAGVIGSAMQAKAKYGAH
ncbi:ROK family protein [Paenibacillaceae bacterium]|nr:ROK family protein [Paenibacillaceae bacterium]